MRNDPGRLHNPKRTRRVRFVFRVVFRIVLRALCVFILIGINRGLVAADRHALYTELLREHVHDGHVRYSALKNDPRLAEYLAQLAATDPRLLTDDAERAAYWLNVYNAFTLKLITERLPLASIGELHLCGNVYLGVLFGRTIWETYEFPLFGGRRYTLDEVEHRILRPEFQDYRHHAALVCAARSCPPLRSEAYEGARLSEQLDDQMRIWLASTERNRYDPVHRTLYLSSVFNWFSDDFERGQRDIVDVLLPYLPPEVQARVRADRNRLRVKYLTYDWSLNGD